MLLKIGILLFFEGNLTVAKMIRSFLVFLRDFFTPRVLLLIRAQESSDWEKVLEEYQLRPF